MIIITDGTTKPIVAERAPNTPAVVKPVNVAIFTPIGPGVDSDTAIMLDISFIFIHSGYLTAIS